MTHEWLHSLQIWREFYSFGGTAAATLLGLMFVVVSLARRNLTAREGSLRVVQSFFTPIVVFFATMIVVTMVMLIPEAAPVTFGALLLLVAVAGIIYMVASGAHTAWRTNELGLDDLMWYVALPYIAYTALAAGGVGVISGAGFGFDATAASMVLLLLIGIRNAWDLVVYTVQHDHSTQDATD